MSRGWGNGERGWTAPEKKIIFAPKNGVWVHFNAVLIGRKYGQSQEALHWTRILRFNHETKLTQQLSYRKQIARKLRTQYVERICLNITP